MISGKGGKGGMVGTMEKIDNAVANVARKRAEKKYDKDSKLCREIFDNRYGASWNISSKDEERQREIVINTLMLDEKKRLEYDVKENFGLGREFDLNSYSQEQLENFFLFYLEDILDSEEGLLYNGKGKSSPNQHVAQYIKKKIIKYWYEKYYDYIVKYRNELVGKSELKNGFKDNKRMGALYLFSGKSDIREFGDGADNPVKVWCAGLGYIRRYFEDWTKDLREKIEGNEEVDHYKNFLFGKMGVEWMLTLCDQVLESLNLDEKFIFEIQKTLVEAFDYAKKSIVSEKYDFIRQYGEKDIFKDYAIMYYMSIEQNENRITDGVLKELYQLACNDNRKGYLEITPEMNDEKYIKESLFVEKGKRYDFQKLKQKKKFANQFSRALSEAMNWEYSAEKTIIFVACVEEIYDIDRKITVRVDGKEKEYNMVKLAHDLMNGKYKEFKNRNEEVIFLNEKIKRGMDCRMRNKDYYLLKNSLYRSVYEIENKVFEERKKKENFILFLPFYWLEIINYLVDPMA